MDQLTKLQSALSDRYAVQREIGAGGMATVYLAEDVRHRRKVALKVLQSELAAVLGPERFLSEINVTANLQHPHLLPLFDSGEADRLLFYVMPYIEGESLRARLNREKQLPVDEAIRITIAAASALDYAHRHGVVHRDLKPENILLHDGQPLVSDFGIALAVSKAGGTRVTQTGLSLGTPQYMSPEQATGDRNIDARSDIYSLAAVLYEMLTGEPPHTGATVQAIIARVLTDKVRSVRATRDSVPIHVDATVQKALSKLPADRFATALQFAEALQRPQTMAATAAWDQPAASPATRSWKRPRTVLPWLVAAIGLAVGAASLLPSPEPVTPPSARFAITLPSGVETPSGGSLTGFAISPDGRTIVFNAIRNGREMLYVRDLDDVQVRELPGTAGAILPFFSPDGQWVGFFAPGEQRLKRIAIAGGTALPIANVSNFAGAAWGADGVIVFASAAGAGLSKISVRGGVEQPFTQLDSGDVRHVMPSFLPDGRRVIFNVIAARRYIALADETGNIRRTDIEGSLPQYLASGHLLYNTPEGTLLSQPFDPRRPEVGREATVVLSDVRVTGNGVGIWRVSNTGMLVYDAGMSTGRLAIVDRAGRVTSLTEEPRRFRMPRVSPDGNRIAVEIAGTGREVDLWLFDRGTGTLTRFSADGVTTDARWSTDGKRIAFARRVAQSDGTQGVNIFQRQTDLSSGEDTLVTGAGNRWPWSWTPDGKTLVYDELLPGKPTRIMSISVDRSTPPRAVVESPFVSRLGMLSPNGKWLAYTSNESGRVEVYIRPFPGPGSSSQISTAGGTQPMWSRDGNELFYREASKMMAARLTTTPQIRVTSRTPLFDDRFLTSNATNYDVLPDGRFIMIESASGSTPQLFAVVNWKPPVGQ